MSPNRMVPLSLRNDGRVVGVPLEDHRALFHGLPVLEVEHRAVGRVVGVPDPLLVVQHLETTLPAGDDQTAFRLVLHHGQVLGADGPVELGPDLRLLHDARGDAAHMEGPQGELGARLADGLGRDDPHRLADIHHPPGGQVAAVAARAHAALGLAGEHRADLDRLDPRLLDPAGVLFGDLRRRLHQHLVGDGVEDVVRGHAAEDALADGLDDLLALLERADLDPEDRAAVILVDDHVLGHVPPGAG